jgi:hypothetical protein
MASPIGANQMKIFFYAMVCALLLSFAGQTWASPSQQQIKYMLIDEAQSQGVSPALVLAIAKVESDFNPKALSHMGALGVMQIMPATAKQGFNVASHELYDAKVNIRIGVAFIKQLIEQYNGKIDIALSHYNGGSAVRRPNGSLNIIPATQGYVSKVQQFAQQYRQQGYDQAIGNLPLADKLMANNSRQPMFSYAELMALDEIDDSLSVEFTPRPTLSKLAPSPRVDELQQLREHNLTRLLPAKQKMATVELFALNDTQSYTGEFDEKTPPSTEPVIRSKAPLQELNSKQQKVAQWESIF